MDGPSPATEPRAWTPTTLRTEDWLLAAPPSGPAVTVTATATAVDAMLHHGPGFAVLRDLDLEGRTDRECVDRCAELVALLRAPVGGRLHRSANELLTAATAPAVHPGPPGASAPARPSEGDALTLPPHMDRGEGPTPPHVLALLCVRPAAEGGASLLAAGTTVHNRLLADDPAALRELYGDFHFGRGPGFDRVRPVFRRDGDTLDVHYNRYWIDRGQDETGTPHPPARRHALDVVDRLLADPATVLRLPLRRGDLLLVNNDAVLHGRTAFQDTGTTRRRYARVWAD
ncbi:TauD/TfdA family dioxygenase [Streptomyces sp. NPDC056503]|uniref:TauD/TfdA family dioxygenase n=1 Tax=Streptomyces sp. NPDC056503 TaxID=3345842 RepID=UPI0036B7EBA2